MDSTETSSVARCSHDNNEHPEETLSTGTHTAVDIDVGCIEFDYSMLDTLQAQGSDYRPTHCSNGGKVGTLSESRLRDVLTAMRHGVNLPAVKLKLKQVFVPPHRRSGKDKCKTVYEIEDGRHRCVCAVLLGISHISAIVSE